MAANANETYERIKTRLKVRLVSLIDGGTTTQRPNIPRKELEGSLRQTVKAFAEDNRSLQLSAEEQERLIQEALNDVVGYGPLDALLADQTISEIMVNGPSEIFIERNGRLQRVDAKFNDTNHLMAVIERMLSSVNLTVNESTPICDASLPDGSRLNVIIPPLVLNGPVITIRRKLRDWTMDDYLKLEALDRPLAEFLEACVKAKVNFVISGGTSSGKTTLVSILTTFIPSDQRIITIENVSEFDLPGREHWIRLVGKTATLEGRGEIPLRALVKNALRMRPDRIVLGEARGGEALDVVQAMHSGHDGFMTVLHANSASAALERLETLMLMSGLEVPPSACRIQIASAVDLVVHVGRFADGSRRLSTVTQVLGATEGGFVMEDLFTFEATGFSSEGQLHGGWRYTGAKPKFLSKFLLNNVPVPSGMTT